MDRTVHYSHGFYPEVASWFTARSLPIPSHHSLPTNGFIVPGVAAGFLYLTDSDVSILDCFISNPKTTEVERDEALDSIAHHLIACASLHDTKILICNTTLKAIKDRAVFLGFTDTGTHFALAKELN
jgi:hypothetical protein